VGFFYLLISHREDEKHLAVEYLISDVLLPFAKTKMNPKSHKERNPLSQELGGIVLSRRRKLLS
jgi:hypothetical protein